VNIEKPNGHSRVLVVDDEEAMLETVSALLEDDFEFVCRSSGTAALNEIEHQSFEVICTDYQMPGMTGLELLAEVERRELMMGFVLMTGRYEAYSEDERRARDGTALPLSVVLKPYKPEDLIDAVRRASTFTRMRRAVSRIGSSRPKTKRS
jgi:two-component system response regulator HupR/HoxA